MRITILENIQIILWPIHGARKRNYANRKIVTASTSHSIFYYCLRDREKKKVYLDKNYRNYLNLYLSNYSTIQWRYEKYRRPFHHTILTYRNTNRYSDLRAGLRP